jgi:hypothetical protein
VCEFGVARAMLLVGVGLEFLRERGVGKGGDRCRD